MLSENEYIDKFFRTFNSFNYSSHKQKSNDRRSLRKYLCKSCEYNFCWIIVKLLINITIVNFPFENFITASSPASNFSWTHSLPADFKLSKALLANSVYSDSNASTSNQYGLSSRNIQRIYQNQLYSCESFYIIFMAFYTKSKGQQLLYDFFWTILEHG